MITKRALLIGYPVEKGEKNYCENGVDADIKNYKRYLMSLSGGAWERDEIITVKNITSTELRKYIFFLGKFDYSIVIFSGHGRYDINESTTKIEINKNENIAVEDLFTECERQLFIFDCCRSNPLLFQENQENYYFASNEADYSYLRNVYKEKYDSNLRKSGKGIIQIFSCSVGETSQDWDRRGGMFSYNYIQSSKGDTDMSVKDVFEIAEQRVIKVSGNKQHPQIYRPRSGETFPFYIA